MNIIVVVRGGNSEAGMENELAKIKRRFFWAFFEIFFGFVGCICIGVYAQSAILFMGILMVWGSVVSMADYIVYWTHTKNRYEDKIAGRG